MHANSRDHKQIDGNVTQGTGYGWTLVTTVQSVTRNSAGGI
jgi:hypothetical protein